MRTLVVGDIHGARRALEQVLERSRFDPARDRVVFLGDVADGWSEPAEAIALLASIGAESVLGNHDAWLLDWLETEVVDPMWVGQRGDSTLDVFGRDVDEALDAALPFLRAMEPFIHDDRRDHLFVHGGLPREHRSWRPPAPVPGEELWWDRSLFSDVIAARGTGRDEPLTTFDRVFIGHCPTTLWDLGTEPVIAAGVVALDTGAGYDGHLTLMDADTLEYWQSDPVPELYPEEAAGR